MSKINDEERMKAVNVSRWTAGVMVVNWETLCRKTTSRCSWVQLQILKRVLSSEMAYEYKTWEPG